MADLYVLEGRGGHGGHGRSNHRIAPRRKVGFSQVPGILYGDPLQVLLGRSLLSKIGSVAKSAAKVAVAPVTASYSVSKALTKATVNAVKNPSLSNVTKIVTAPVVRATNETKSVVKEAAHATAESARATNTAVSRTVDVTRRVAKRLIKKLAKSVLFHGEPLLGSAVAAVPKNAAKGILIPVATTAVLANTVTAPAAPVVPVLVNEVIDELYNSISNAIAKGLSPDAAAKQAQADLDKLEPGEENDPKPGGISPIFLIGGAALLAFLFLRRS